MSLRWSRVAAVAAAASCCPLAAQNARVDYAALHRVLAPAPELQSFDRLHLVQRIESRDPGVRPEQIRLTVESRKGAILLEVAEDGGLAFPMSPDLLDENPAVVSNQPSGSLRASLSVELRAPNGLQWSYSDLWEGMQQAEQAARLQPDGSNATSIEGVELRFAPESNARVLIVYGTAERLLLADPAGRVYIRRDPALLQADARLQISGVLHHVLPRTATVQPLDARNP